MYIIHLITDQYTLLSVQITLIISKSNNLLNVTNTLINKGQLYTYKYIDNTYSMKQSILL